MRNARKLRIKVCDHVACKEHEELKCVYYSSTGRNGTPKASCPAHPQHDKNKGNPLL